MERASLMSPTGYDALSHLSSLKPINTGWVDLMINIHHVLTVKHKFTPRFFLLSEVDGSCFLLQLLIGWLVAGAGRLQISLIDFY